MSFDPGRKTSHHGRKGLLKKHSTAGPPQQKQQQCWGHWHSWCLVGGLEHSCSSISINSHCDQNKRGAPLELHSYSTDLSLPSWIPELPWVQQTLAAAALITAALAACSCLALPSSCSHLILFPACVIYSAGYSHPWEQAGSGSRHASLVPWVPDTQLPTHPRACPSQQPLSLF